MLCVDLIYLMILLAASEYGIAFTLLTSLLTSLAATFAELATRNGNDTVTVPLADAIVFQIWMWIHI